MSPHAHPEATGPGLYAAALARLPGIGPARVRQLVAYFGDPRSAWEAAPADLKQALGLSDGALASVLAARRPELLASLDEGLRRCGARVVTLWDAEYPGNLREMPDPPPVLFVRGTLEGRDRLAVAIVGSRSAALSGVMAAEHFAFELASAGLTIVSGLAAGIDAAAHRAAMRARGRTVGVLGCGPDRVYPAEHEALYRRVEASGALISEFPPGTGPAPWQFAARNRIIAGLSAAVLVVEARARSGAISTALAAEELSREVLVAPGDVLRATCRGSNRLIADGARICLRSEDVLDAVLQQLSRWKIDVGALRPPQGQASCRTGRGGRDAGASGPAPEFLQLMGNRPWDLEDLSSRFGLSIGRLLSLLTEAEACGQVKRLPDGRWVRRAAPRSSQAFSAPDGGL